MKYLHGRVLQRVWLLGMVLAPALQLSLGMAPVTRKKAQLVTCKLTRNQFNHLRAWQLRRVVERPLSLGMAHAWPLHRVVEPKPERVKWIYYFYFNDLLPLFPVRFLWFLFTVSFCERIRCLPWLELGGQREHALGMEPIAKNGKIDYLVRLNGLTLMRSMDWIITFLITSTGCGTWTGTIFHETKSIN